MVLLQSHDVWLLGMLLEPVAILGTLPQPGVDVLHKVMMFNMLPKLRAMVATLIQRMLRKLVLMFCMQPKTCGFSPCSQNLFRILVRT